MSSRTFSIWCVRLVQTTHVMCKYLPSEEIMKNMFPLEMVVFNGAQPQGCTYGRLLREFGQQT